MTSLKRRLKYYAASLIKHDFKASVNVFFESLPLIVGVAVASDAPIYTGFIAGVVGAFAFPLLGKANLAITGPGAGLITVSAAAVIALGHIEFFFAAVFLAGFFQVLLGSTGMGKLAYFIPSVVIKGLLAAVGIILIINQLPLTVGYDSVTFSEGEYLSILAIRNSIKEIMGIRHHFSPGVLLISLVSAAILFRWDKKLTRHIRFLPVYSLVIVVGVLMALVYRHFIPGLILHPAHYIAIPSDLIHSIRIHNIIFAFDHAGVWRSALIICLVASIQSLATIHAIDKIDTYHRALPKNNTLVALGTCNMLSGLLGGLPVMALIARSTTNVESGARTPMASVYSGLWLLASVLLISYLINHIPHCVLAVILIKVGTQLINPSLVYTLYKTDKKQLYPFLVTVLTILFAGIVVGILAGIIYTFYLLARNNYKNEFVLRLRNKGHQKHYTLCLSRNVSFLNKKAIIEALEKVPDHSIVEVVGSKGINVDLDIMEIFSDFKLKARPRDIKFITIQMPGLTAVGNQD